MLDPAENVNVELTYIHQNSMETVSIQYNWSCSEGIPMDFIFAEISTLIFSAGSYIRKKISCMEILSRVFDLFLNLKNRQPCRHVISQVIWRTFHYSWPPLHEVRTMWIHYNARFCRSQDCLPFKLTVQRQLVFRRRGGGRRRNKTSEMCLNYSLFQL